MENSPLYDKLKRFEKEKSCGFSGEPSTLVSVMISDTDLHALQLESQADGIPLAVKVQYGVHLVLRELYANEPSVIFAAKERIQQLNDLLSSAESHASSNQMVEEG